MYYIISRQRNICSPSSWKRPFPTRTCWERRSSTGLLNNSNPGKKLPSHTSRRKSSQIFPWCLHYSSNESIPGQQQQVRRREEMAEKWKFCPQEGATGGKVGAQYGSDDSRRSSGDPALVTRRPTKEEMKQSLINRLSSGCRPTRETRETRESTTSTSTTSRSGPSRLMSYSTRSSTGSSASSSYILDYYSADKSSFEVR